MTGFGRLLGTVEWIREMESIPRLKDRLHRSIKEWSFFMESKQQKVLRLVFLSMMIGLGVVISPILRVEGMCPMAHLINITCSVMLGPWYSLLCATLIGIIRMTVMGIPPLALTGAVFGAALSGIFYRVSGGKIIAACLGEVIAPGSSGPWCPTL